MEKKPVVKCFSLSGYDIGIGECGIRRGEWAIRQGGWRSQCAKNSEKRQKRAVFAVFRRIWVSDAMIKSVHLEIHYNADNCLSCAYRR
jgi:hypothetical protein